MIKGKKTKNKFYEEKKLFDKKKELDGVIWEKKAREEKNQAGEKLLYYYKRGNVISLGWRNDKKNKIFE